MPLGFDVRRRSKVFSLAWVRKVSISDKLLAQRKLTKTLLKMTELELSLSKLNDYLSNVELGLFHSILINQNPLKKF